MIDISPLRESRSFRLLWFGQLVSLSGTQLRLVAIPYQIYLITGSSLDVGLIGLFQASVYLRLFVGPRIGSTAAAMLLTRAVCALSAVLAIGTAARFANVLPVRYDRDRLAFSASTVPPWSLTPSLLRRISSPQRSR